MSQTETPVQDDLTDLVDLASLCQKEADGIEADPTQRDKYALAMFGFMTKHVMNEGDYRQELYGGEEIPTVNEQIEAALAKWGAAPLNS